MGHLDCSNGLIPGWVQNGHQRQEHQAGLALQQAGRVQAGRVLIRCKLAPTETSVAGACLIARASKFSL